MGIELFDKPFTSISDKYAFVNQVGFQMLSFLTVQ